MISFVDVAQFGSEYIRRTEQPGLPSVEDYDPSQRPDKMRTLRRLSAGLGVRRSCMYFFFFVFGNGILQFLFFLWSIHGFLFVLFTEPFGTLWSQARKLFAGKEIVH